MPCPAFSCMVLQLAGPVFCSSRFAVFGRCLGPYIFLFWRSAVTRLWRRGPATESPVRPSVAQFFGVAGLAFWAAHIIYLFLFCGSLAPRACGKIPSGLWLPGACTWTFWNLIGAPHRNHLEPDPETTPEPHRNLPEPDLGTARNLPEPDPRAEPEHTGVYLGWRSHYPLAYAVGEKRHKPAKKNKQTPWPSWSRWGTFWWCRTTSCSGRRTFWRCRTTSWSGRRTLWRCRTTSWSGRCTFWRCGATSWSGWSTFCASCSAPFWCRSISSTCTQRCLCHPVTGRAHAMSSFKSLL